MRKRLLTILSIIIIAALFTACSPAVDEPATNEPADNGPYTFGTVVKSIAFNWFLRLEEGVLDYAEDSGNEAFMQGPSQADSAAQVQIIESLIAQGVDGICNVPYGVPENEPAQKKAMDAGIFVVTHEASTASEGTVNYDVEPFDNCAYGEEIMIELASRMGEEGQYVQFVGKFESKEDQEVGYNLFKDLLDTYPDLKGMQGSAAGDVVSAGRAIEEAGLNDQIAVVGTSITSYAGELLQTGAVDLAMGWDPALSGYVCNVLLEMLVNGEEVVDGMDLGVPGYENITLTVGENGAPVIFGSAWIKINADNMLDYDF